jgi:hypothetical protein
VHRSVRPTALTPNRLSGRPFRRRPSSASAVTTKTRSTHSHPTAGARREVLEGAHLAARIRRHGRRRVSGPRRGAVAGSTEVGEAGNARQIRIGRTFRRTPGVGRICFCASENVVASAAPSPRNTPGPGSGMRDTGVNVLERSGISQQQISGLRRFRGFPVVLAERHCRGEDALNKWPRQQWPQSPDQTFSRHQLANWPTPVKQEKS